MHLPMCVFAAMGFLHVDASLRELLFGHDIFALGSAQQILAGKDFDRALLKSRYVDEAQNNKFLVRSKSGVMIAPLQPHPIHPNPSKKSLGPLWHL